MNVHASDNQQAQQAWMNAKPKRPDARADAQDGIAKTKDSEITVPAEVTNAEGSKGVIRLLQAGHFSGVADVRLRINFHDQLQQGAAQNAAKAFEEAVPGLLDELAEKLGRVGEEYDLSPQEKELAEAFAQEMHLLLEEAKTGQTPLAATLAGIGSRFSTFLESLAGALAGSPAPVEEDQNPLEEANRPVHEDGAPEPDDQALDQTAAALSEEADGVPEEGVGQPDEGSTVLKTALQEISDWFSRRLDEVQNDAAAAQQLPPLSEPRGKGAAYAKFLEIYRNLNSETGTPSSANDSGAARVSTDI